MRQFGRSLGSVPRVVTGFFDPRTCLVTSNDADVWRKEMGPAHSDRPDPLSLFGVAFCSRCGKQKLTSLSNRNSQTYHVGWV